MSPEAVVLEDRMLNLLKGFVAKPERETKIRLLKGALSTGTDLLAELRAEEIVESRKGPSAGS